ncbi:HlyD family efflux transporter periplasmic adaptor subunit [Desulfolucanica intricata]|uniref:HlyD family efflux transporter periplasmic adaptor subunit n=1 Tax=Desulfolucanica intricata TaxID=1285191 RepID=UPI001EE4D769|nr:HlyD family efflux transporter periplasmic adaptor subunit [Desulfolucanica intricata]
MFTKKESISRFISKHRFGTHISLLFIIILLFAGFKTWSFIVYKLMDIKILVHGEIYGDIDLEGLLLKREKVIKAPVRGTVNYFINDGERIHLGAPVATIKTPDLNAAAAQANSVLYTPGAGVFCLHLDGYEEILSIDKLDVLQIPNLEKITSKAADTGGVGQKGQADQVVTERGQPIYKIVDNLSPILVKVQVSNRIIPEKFLKSGQRVHFFWEKHSLFGKIVDYRRQGLLWDILISLDEYPDDLIHHRKVQFSMSLQELSGLLIERKSIVVVDGRPGIYVLNKKDIEWAPVKFEGQVKNKVLISGKGIAVGTRYIHNPTWYKLRSLIS